MMLKNVCFDFYVPFFTKFSVSCEVLKIISGYILLEKIKYFAYTYIGAKAL